MEDSRVTKAREVLAEEETAGNWSPLHNALDDLLAYSEERLRVNVGLVHENGALRKRVAELEHGSP